MIHENDIELKEIDNEVEDEYEEEQDEDKKDEVQSELSHTISGDELNNFINEHFVLLHTLEDIEVKHGCCNSYLKAFFKILCTLKTLRTIFILGIITISAVGIFALSSVVYPQLIAAILGTGISFITHTFLPYKTLKKINEGEGENRAKTNKTAIVGNHKKLRGIVATLITDNQHRFDSIKSVLNSKLQNIASDATDKALCTLSEVILNADEFSLWQSEAKKLEEGNIGNTLRALQQQGKFAAGQPEDKEKKGAHNYKATINFLYLQLALCEISLNDIEALGDTEDKLYTYDYQYAAAFSNFCSVVCASVAIAVSFTTSSAMWLGLTIPSILYLSAILLTGIAAAIFIIGNYRVNAANKMAKINNEIIKMVEISNKIKNINNFLKTEHKENNSRNKQDIDRLKKRQSQNRRVLNSMSEAKGFDDLIDKLHEEKIKFINQELKTIQEDFNSKYPDRKLDADTMALLDAKDEKGIEVAFTDRLKMITDLQKEKEENPYEEKDLAATIQKSEISQYLQKAFLQCAEDKKQNWVSSKKIYENIGKRIKQLQRNYKKAISPKLETLIREHNKEIKNTGDTAIINVNRELNNCNNNELKELKVGDNEKLKDVLHNKLQDIEKYKNNWQAHNHVQNAINPYAALYKSTTEELKDYNDKMKVLHSKVTFTKEQEDMQGVQAAHVNTVELSKNKYNNMLTIFNEQKESTYEHIRNLSYAANSRF